MHETHFHPYLNHFPLAFFLLEAFLLFLWRRKREEAYERFAYLVLKLAVAAMPFVMIAGLIDARGLPPLVKTHFALAVVLFVLNSTRLLFRWRRGPALWNTSGSARFYLVWVLASVLLTVATGHWGGLLVYD